MVRLKAFLNERYIVESQMFQFQNGAIKSICSPPMRALSFPSFNSKMVRLKGRDKTVFQRANEVSIPKWCD